MRNNDRTLHTVAIHVPPEGIDLDGPHYRSLSRVPQAGEYVCLGPSEPCHKVIAVVHCPFDGPCVAEIVTESKGVKLADLLGSRGS
jgi:hypothetical protein